MVLKEILIILKTPLDEISKCTQAEFYEILFGYIELELTKIKPNYETRDITQIAEKLFKDRALTREQTKILLDPIHLKSTAEIFLSHI